MKQSRPLSQLSKRAFNPPKQNRGRLNPTPPQRPRPAGGVDGGLHITDASNASRTNLMDLRKLNWHEETLRLFGVPPSMLPEIRSNAEVYG